MKTKNSKLFLVGITLFTICSSALAACSSSSSTSGNGTTYCQLVKELNSYTELKATATAHDTFESAVNVTFTNNGDQYVPIYSFDTQYCDKSGIVVSDMYTNHKCPFEHRYIAPKETFSVITDYYPYGSQSNCVNAINSSKSIRTCYYTSEYTGMKFSELKIKTVDEEYRKKNRLYANCYLYYKPSGKFKDGDNYHMLINFTYDGEEFTVMSNDPCYEINAFGLDFEHAYYINFHGWDDPNGYYKDYVFDENKITVNWVKCYTAWFRDKQSVKCRDLWRCYVDKTGRFLSKLFIGIGISALIVGGIAAFVIIARKKIKADN